MENILYTENQPVETPKRPQFLTVICILTYIGSALAIISGIYTFFTVDASAAMFDNMNMTGATDPTGMMGSAQEAMRLAVVNKIPNLLIAIICSSLCIFGAMQMWQLKKTGYYVYIAGEIIPPIAAFILGGGGMLGSMGAAIALVIAIVWIILYGVNLKHMK